LVVYVDEVTLSKARIVVVFFEMKVAYQRQALVYLKGTLE